MSLLRFEPVFRDLDRLTDAALGTGRGAPQLLRMDVYRRGQTFHVDLDLPGADPDSLDLTAERGSLTVRAARRAPFAEDDQVLVSERPSGEFTRQLVLSDTLDAGGVEASYSDGVLHLTIPVREQDQPRRVPISTGSTESGDQPRVIEADQGEESPTAS